MDTVHFAMRYEDTHGRRKTNGSSWLRLALQRFSKRSDHKLGCNWGGVYYGDHIAASADEDALLEQIKECSMPRSVGEEELKSLAQNAEVPFESRSEFLRAMAAIVAVHRDEVMRQLPKGGGSLLHLVWQGCQIFKIEWMLNYTRFIHSISSAEFVVLPRGTASNEAYHAELNSAFRRVHQLHVSALETRLKAITLAKLLSHNSALYRAGTRQLPSAAVLMRTVAATQLFTVKQWQQWLKQPSDALVHADFQRAERKRLRDWKQDQANNVRKKPSGSRRLILQRPTGVEVVHSTPPESAAKHRTVFRLMRKTRL